MKAPSPPTDPARGRSAEDAAAFAWNLAGQGGAAGLGLLLVKLSVTLFPVQVFGAVALLLGLQALARSTLLNPLLNLAIYRHPEALRQGGAGALHAAARRAILVPALVSLPLFALLIRALDIPAGQSGWAALLLSLLLASEALKTSRLNLLHVQDRPRAYAAWTLADAAAKPLAVLLVAGAWAGTSPLALLGAHALGSVGVLGASALFLRLPPSLAQGTQGEAPLPVLAWIRQHRAFLVPLVGIGFVGWLTGLSDRFLVNLFQGPAQAGYYAGIYGLFSLPFILTGNAMVLATRPRLLDLCAEEDPHPWRKEHWRRFRTLALLLATLGIGLYACRGLLVRLALAPGFLAVLPLVPGILLGNAVLALGTYLELAFYLHQRTDLALVKQSVGGAGSVILVLLAVPVWGLAGAAWACGLYATLEFLAGALLLRHLRSQGPSASALLPQDS